MKATLILETLLLACPAFAQVVEHRSKLSPSTNSTANSVVELHERLRVVQDWTPFGVTTNREPIVLSAFTNSSGLRVSNAVFLKAFTEGALYRVGDALGKASWTALPKTDWERLGRPDFPTTNTLLRASEKALSTPRDGELRRQEASQQEIEKTGQTVKGRVLEIMPEGYLLQAQAIDDGRGGKTFEGLCYVESNDSITDGAGIEARMYPNGWFSFQSVGAGRKTVQRFAGTYRSFSGIKQF